MRKTRIHRLHLQDCNRNQSGTEAVGRRISRTQKANTMPVDTETCVICDGAGTVIGDSYDEWGRCEVEAGYDETCICQIEE